MLWMRLRPAGEILVEHKGLWNAEGVTKLANKLARLCYFGDDVLVQSTLTGREGDALDERRMQALLGDVKRYACGMMTQSEFDVQIRPKVREGISSLCRRLRNLEKKKKKTNESVVWLFCHLSLEEMPQLSFHSPPFQI